MLEPFGEHRSVLLVVHLDDHGFAHGQDEFLEKLRYLLFPADNERVEQIEAVEFSALLRDAPFLADLPEQLVDLVAHLLLDEQPPALLGPFREGRKQLQIVVRPVLRPLRVHIELDVFLQSLLGVFDVLVAQLFEGFKALVFDVFILVEQP
eukprot:CAMPEP_0116897472 /NCGR_PEP_ID=MMETSP0467-20121206/6439_1 /TAXON_ID=283647 /ORGANISM="Mesodinium pulex, Strain SPMC105" /LENGTH=150 /DNA_ID=CAMNT_0004569123 /DNA_START=1658 /DNA_END=2110 /DNA_ORIENTATION=-